MPGPIRTQQPAVALGRAHRPLPEPNDHLYLAAVDFSPMSYVTDGHRTRAEAIARRYTDRLPFGPPQDWDSRAAIPRIIFCSMT